MTDVMEGQLSLFDQNGWCGKMYPELLAVTVEETSKPSSRKSQGSPNRNAPLCLCLTRDGAKPDASTMRWEDGQLLGEYTMDSTGEQPYTMTKEMLYNEEHRNGVNESHLSQILVDLAHPKYSLSVKACTGILRRAEKRGKELPSQLKEALENQINPDRIGGGELNRYDTFRKTSHPRTSDEGQGYEPTSVSDTLNVFDTTESRTPNIVVGEQ